MKKKLQNQFVALFKEESQRYLDSLNSEILQYEKKPGDPDLLDQMMRELHSLKGAANMIGLLEIGRFTHLMEDAFLRLKGNEFGPLEFDLLFSSLEMLRKMIDDATSDDPQGINSGEMAKKLKAFKKRKLIKKIFVPEKAEPLHNKDLSSFKVNIKDSLQIDIAKIDSLMSLANELLIQKAHIFKKPLEMQNILDKTKYLNSLIRKLAQDEAMPAELYDQADKMDSESRDLRDRTSFLLEDLANQANLLTHLIDNLEDISIKMRMLPLSVIFLNMQRLVRNLAKEKEKQIKLVFAGEETELDKKVIELIQDPIMHLIRNSIDHGIEAPKERKSAGKLPEGVIILNAFQRGNRIIIEIEDDGAGIDKEKIRQAAASKNLVSEAEANKLSDAQVFELLLLPGFSMQKEVTELSGRGVGLNVVCDSINRLQGDIRIESQLGVNTKFILDLPITVAVTSVLLFSCCEQTFSIPLSEVKETISEDKMQNDPTIPVFSLDELLGLPKSEKPSSKVFLMLEFMQKKIAFAVDKLEGEEHVVIKGMGSYLGKVKNILGAAILGDAQLVLVLDLPEMLGSKWRQLVVE